MNWVREKGGGIKIEFEVVLKACHPSHQVGK